MTDLYTFRGRSLVGVFRPRATGLTTFEYAPAWRVGPISLSLPLDRPAEPGAADAFLDNLLPDRDDVRERWARDRHLPNTDPVTLLAAYGEDVAGALTLTSDPDLPTREPEQPITASEEDIASRIAALTHEATSWHDPRTHPRMSLAGAQGKFTLAHELGDWLWPNYNHPSTHVLKPPAARHKDLDTFEHLGLELAHQIGLRASHSEVMSFLGQRTFVVERWDRAPVDDERGVVRLHAEDLNQALGRRTDAKYQVSAVEVARLLDQHGLAYQFVHQLAFNAAFGNSDAHAKNYSLLLDGPKLVLAPLYDTVPVFLWPQYDSSMAMPIGGARQPAELTEGAWRRFAEGAGLDGDRVCAAAFAVTQAVADHYLDVFAPHIDATRLQRIAKRVKILQRTIPNDAGTGQITKQQLG